MTPALTNSKNKYSESWNLSFTRAVLIATYIARARGECVCELSRNLLCQVANRPGGNGQTTDQFWEDDNKKVTSLTLSARGSAI